MKSVFIALFLLLSGLPLKAGTEPPQEVNTERRPYLVKADYLCTLVENGRTVHCYKESVEDISVIRYGQRWRPIGGGWDAVVTVKGKRMKRTLHPLKVEEETKIMLADGRVEVTPDCRYKYGRETYFLFTWPQQGEREK